MQKKIILVMDCGATNVRSIAVSEKGEMLAMHSIANNTQPDPFYRGGLIWDVNEIWDKLIRCTHEVLKHIDKNNIAGVTVTTFGVNGAPMDKQGNLIYPVISWQCSRTVPVMENIGKYIPLEELFAINGLQPFSFNTINYLAWFKENRPEVLEKMDYFVFISSIFLYFLTGEYVTDTTMAGTSMLTDIAKRDFSDALLSLFSVNREKFPFMAEPGEVIGKINEKASKVTGIPQGIPVMAAGHDTQFAIYGSGADENVPVLSTGTWEILMVRSRKYDTSPEVLKNSITTEYDAIKGLYNPGCQWIGSGLLEWVKKMLYSSESGDKIYDTMIGEAELVDPGCGGVKVNPSFFADKAGAATGAITGLNLNTKREAIYRAAIEALSYNLKTNMLNLEKIGGFKAESLIVVGGGSKNRLWNQVRADMLGIPVKLIDQKETTVLGAALFALAGAGIYSSADEARKAINYNAQVVEPGSDAEFYK